MVCLWFYHILVLFVAAVVTGMVLEVVLLVVAAPLVMLEVAMHETMAE